MMTVKEIADYLHIATSTAYRLTKQRELPGLKVGGGWRFDIRTIDKWRLKMQEVLNGQVPEDYGD
jgi:excisionase family DNA binding protein